MEQNIDSRINKIIQLLVCSHGSCRQNTCPCEDWVSLADVAKSILVVADKKPRKSRKKNLTN